MPLRHYGALGPSEAEALQSHLESCRACGREWEEVRRVLAAVDPATVFPGEAGVDWRKFTRMTVERALAAGRETRPKGRDALRRFFSSWPAVFAAPARVAALCAAVVVAALVLGSWLRPGGTRTARVPASGGEAGIVPLTPLLESAHVMEDRLARRGAARYLSDSRALLVNLVGATARCRRTEGRYDIALEKEKSRQLLRRKNLYEGDLLALEDQRLATLVRQLESVLMQVAALDDCTPARPIHDLREEIERRQILLRIDLVTRELRGRADVV